MLSFPSCLILWPTSSGVTKALIGKETCAGTMGGRERGAASECVRRNGKEKKAKGKNKEDPLAKKIKREYKVELQRTTINELSYGDFPLILTNDFDD